MAEHDSSRPAPDPVPDDEDVEEASLESFPASDPPAWTGTTAGSPDPGRSTDPVHRTSPAGDGSTRAEDGAVARQGIPGAFTHAVIYDGNCRTCVHLADVVRRWDRRERFWVVPSNDPKVPERFPWIAADAYQRALQMVGPGQETREGSQAVAWLLDLLPGGTPLARLFSLPLIGPLLDRGYRWFARNRASFGCGDHCTIPLPPDNDNLAHDSALR